MIKLIITTVLIYTISFSCYSQKVNYNDEKSKVAPYFLDSNYNEGGVYFVRHAFKMQNNNMQIILTTFSELTRTMVWHSFFYGENCNNSGLNCNGYIRVNYKGSNKTKYHGRYLNGKFLWYEEYELGNNQFGRIIKSYGDKSSEFKNTDSYNGEIKTGNVTYNGGLLYDLKNGYGISIINGIVKYKGEYLLGLKNGRGIEYFEDGDYYEGEFKNGDLEGKGILHKVIANEDFEVIIKNGQTVSQVKIENAQQKNNYNVGTIAYDENKGNKIKVSILVSFADDEILNENDQFVMVKLVDVHGKEKEVLVTPEIPNTKNVKWLNQEVIIDDYKTKKLKIIHYDAEYSNHRILKEKLFEIVPGIYEMKGDKSSVQFKIEQTSETEKSANIEMPILDKITTERNLKGLNMVVKASSEVYNSIKSKEAENKNLDNKNQKSAENNNDKNSSKVIESNFDVVNEECVETTYGILWEGESCDKCTLTFRDGTIGTIYYIYQDSKYACKGLTKLLGPVLYKSKEFAIKSAYNRAKTGYNLSEGSLGSKQYGSSSTAKKEDEAFVQNKVVDENIDCETESLNRYKLITIKSEGNWENATGFNSDKRKVINFSDGKSGGLYQLKSGNDNKYYFGISYAGFDYFYESKEFALQALYVFKSCEKFTKIGLKY